MKVSDYIADYIAQQGVGHVFGVTGAHILHLVDSIAQHPDLRYIACNHEQGAAFAADAYARVKGFSVCLSTSGPGAVNLASGICSAYFDSIPMLFLTGQVMRAHNKGQTLVRQLGFQETDIVGMYRQNSKMAWTCNDPAMIRYDLSYAIDLAHNRRPGPVLIDLPDDVQRAEISPDMLMEYHENHPKAEARDAVPVEILQGLISEAKRPLVILGAGAHGMRLLLDTWGIPVLLTWGGMDILPYDHPLNMGGFGVCGPAAGNLAVQSADLIIAIGTRLDHHMTGNEPHTFAPDAKVVLVDIDREELEKARRLGLKVLCTIKSDSKEFAATCYRSAGWHTQDLEQWKQQIQHWHEHYPVGDPECAHENGRLNPYKVIAAICEASWPGDVMLTDAGATLCWTMQTWRVKAGQRLLSSWNHSPMGWAVPAAIGAAFASPQSQVLCLTGDGSFHMNVQELATIAKHKLNIKIIVFDNSGYGIIRQTQDQWLDGRHNGSDDTVPLGDPVAVARAYGIRSGWIDRPDQVDFDLTLSQPGPLVMGIKIDPAARIVPKLAKGALQDIAEAQSCA